MSATITIMTFYNYDPSIFDNFVLPDGIEKDDVYLNLVLELCDLELIYSNPGIMKVAIGLWSKKELPIWKKLYDTTKFEYNPIWNLNRTEEYTDKETRNLSGSNNETRALAGTNNETRNLTGSDNQTRDLTGSNNETRALTGSNNESRDLENKLIKHSTTTGTTTNSGTDTSKEYVSGFNETTPTLAKQTEQTLGTGNTVSGGIDGTDTTTDKGTVNTATTDNGTVNTATTDKGTVNTSTTDAGTVNTIMSDRGTVNRAITDEGSVENVRTAKMQGSIGVITTQTMIEQERKVAQFNVINYIINSFKNRFCIQIY